MRLAPHPIGAALVAVVAALAGSAGCGDTTGVPDPGELEVGTFRAELSGADERSLRGDAINYRAQLSGTREPIWWLRLSAPPGTGPDSVRLEFAVKLAGQGLPDAGTYPVNDEGVPRDSFRVQMFLDPDSDGGGTVHEGRSGTVTLTEVVEDEVVAGRFELRTTPVDSTDGATIDVSGAFRSGRD